MKNIYLDYNASFPVKPKILEQLLTQTDSYGNPSSIHFFGRQSRQKIEETRHKFAKCLNVTSDKIIFTSGGTEANNMVLKGFVAEHKNKGTLLISATEHPSVLKTAFTLLGEHCPLINVKKSGIIDLVHLEDFLRRAEKPILVSVMYANNETGVIQPISQIASLTHQYGGLLHCDAVQAFGKINFDFGDDLPDFITFSGHKIGALQGVGVLFSKYNFPYDALISGGGQEKGRRSGTENVLGIESLGLVLSHLNADIYNCSKVEFLRDYMEAQLVEIAPNLVFFGKDAPRLPNTSCFGCLGLAGDMQVISLDLEGIAISAGSACASGKVKPSHVLLAMGASEALAQSAIRISMGPMTTKEDIDYFLKAWTKIYVRGLKDQLQLINQNNG
ncbi:MAG: cysteine desulfurase family protein [Alphaproteobacteria bacterium]|nr:cysteine desulfurase family protein [Alphaproteobacteria bacterium]